jgi:hypothetical protein
MSHFESNQEFFDFSTNMVVVPIKDIVERMKEHHIKLPLFAYRFLLKETIRDDVFEEKRYQSYSDELQYRLRNYDMHSIFLLEKLIKQYDLEFDLAKFKEMLFNFLYVNRDQKEFDRSFFDQLIEMKDENDVDVEQMSYEEFYAIFEPVLFQTIGYIDGIHSDEWSDETLTSHTLGDLKNLGNKYGIKVPRRINKSRLIEILAAKLNLDDEEVELLSKKSILDIEIYAKEKDFRISTDLKKRDMIEYIKFSLDMYHKDIEDDDYDYNFPIPHLEDVLEEDIEEQIDEDKGFEEVILDEEVLEENKPLPDEVEEEAEIEEIMEEPVIEESIEEEPLVEEAEIEEPAEEEKPIKERQATIEEEEHLPEELADSDLLTEEEKELLDEKIAYIIQKYHKKKRRRKTIKWIFIILLILIVGAAAYGYIHYTWIKEGELPFNIPIFW